MGRLLGRTVALAIVVLIGDAHAAAARGSRSRRHRVAVPAPVVPPRTAPLAPPAPPAPAASMSTDAAVRCSCVSAGSCPEIGKLAISGFRTQPVYCNQLHGSENPGVRDETTWTFQCTELANRWLVEGVGAPRIRGNADQLCDNADRRSFEVHSAGRAHEPVPGDLLVWDGYAMGHVGVVASVTPSAIVFANQNYGGGGTQYPILSAPRTAGFFGSPRGDNRMSAKCIIHPRKLASAATPPAAPPPAAPPPAAPPPTGPCARVSTPNDGLYCGASRQSGFAGGDASTLYRCSGGRTTATRCSEACTMEPVGTADHCS